MSADPQPPIWSRPEPGARGAAYTREGIAAAAIEIADAEGFKAVSMRRVAAKLGAGTMTLYHYVRNKRELIDLIDDAIMGELLIPDGEMPTGWRDALTEVARRTRDAFLRHPWTFEIPPGTEGGPNGMMHFEQSLEAVAATGLTGSAAHDVLFMVDDFTFGYALRHNMIKSFFGESPIEIPKEWADSQAARLPLLESGRFPRLAALYGERDPADALKNMMEVALGVDRFEQGLSLLLDGIEGRIKSGWDG